MEQRLAELFLVAGRQGPRTARARRATNVGGYTVQARVNAFFLTRFSGLQRRDERARGWTLMSPPPPTAASNVQMLLAGVMFTRIIGLVARVSEPCTHESTATDFVVMSLPPANWLLWTTDIHRFTSGGPLFHYFGQNKSFLFFLSLKSTAREHLPSYLKSLINDWLSAFFFFT